MRKLLLFFLMLCASIGAWAVSVTVDNSSTETNEKNYYVTVSSTSSDQWWPTGSGWQTVAKNVTFTGDYSGLTWSDAGGSVYNQGGGNSRFDFSSATGVTFANIGTMLSCYNANIQTYPFTGVTKVVLPNGTDIPSDISSLNSSGNLKFVFSTTSNGTYTYNISVTSNLTSTSDLTEDLTSSVITALQGSSTIHIVGDPTACDLVYNYLVTTNNVPAANVTKTPTKDAIEYDDCTITINRDYTTDSMATLLQTAHDYLAGLTPAVTMCTIKIVGTVNNTDLSSLNNTSATGATRIDLSDATLATGASVGDIQVPTTLVSLVLPPGNEVSSTLATTLSSASNFEYVYSNSTDNGETTPTYVWIAKTGVMAHVFANESSLTSAVYLKVAAKSGVTLESTSVDLSQTGMNNLQYLDVSESGLTTAAAPYYKAPHYSAYRIILPNNWSGDDMATFAANQNVGAIAAVYSYSGTTLKILEITDNSYSPAALADPRIMRSSTTEVDVVSGYYNGNTYAQFGANLLAALNNMGNSSFEYVTGKQNTAGLNVRTICIETTSAAPNALTFTNPVITTLNLENLVQNNAELNVAACSALTTLNVRGSNLKSVTASGNTIVASADFSGTAIATTTDFSGATALATFTTTSESIFNGNVDLTSSALATFTSEARFGGNISFNASSSLASVDLSGAKFTSNSSVIHVDAETTEGESNTIINSLQNSNAIQVPSSFEDNVATRIHPYNASYVSVASPVAEAYSITNTDMTFHDKEAGDNSDHYRYWYQGASESQKILTLGTSSSRTLASVLTDNSTTLDLTNTTYAIIKVVGPLTSADITSLSSLNCIALDLSEATYGGSDAGVTIGTLLKSSFSNTTTLGVHSNVKFIALPDSCSRDFILNETALAGLKNSVYCVIAVNETSEGRDLTSYSFQSGSLQPAVVAFQNSAASGWTKILSTDQNPTTKYTSSVSNFKKLKISGLINSYDLSKGDQALDADGHLSWEEDVVESTNQTRTLNGAYSVYGPFSSCYNLTEIDLRDAYFEPLPNQTGLGEESVYFRYWTSDMTLSFLNVISTATYKVVIPQNSKVKEIPADFMRCSTNIRAICIPSNIQAIRTRAFYTIDYVWTTGSTTADPEGDNTKLDNGAKLSDGTAVSALLYVNGAYKENPAFLDSYYTADYSGVDGGGTYTFGSTLKLIETAAFANTQPNVSDVYVLNTTAPECHVDAFNTVMYTGNGGYNSAKVSSEGIITRDAYYNNRWITMLHYPRQTTDPQIQRYTDPTRSYSIATGMRDGKGAILYLPNQSEFIRAYQQGTFGYTWNAWNPTRTNGALDNGSFNGSTNAWTAELQTAANALFDAYSTGTNHEYTSFYKVSGFTGETVTAPTTELVPYYQVHWNPSTYTYSTVTNDLTGTNNLYPMSEIDNNSDADGSGEKTEKDYRGWHQFVLNAYAANTVLEEESYRSYITDNEWWTICPEFDITRSEAALLFGQLPGVQISNSSPAVYPKIHKLRYVRREYSGETIYLNFTQDLATYKENRSNTSGTYTRENGEANGEITSYTNADQHGSVNSTTGIIETLSNTPAGDDVVMSAGVPYLIKPNLPANGQRQFRIFKSLVDAYSYNNNKQDGDPIGYANENLWAKIKFAQEMNGDEQRTLVKSGAYTVPVFVSVADGDGVEKESVEMDGSSPKEFRPNDETSSSVAYYRSADRHYTFVGTLYNSFLPHYCYFLGWDSANNCAKFYYHNGNFDAIDHEMRWANGTGVIVPVLEDDLSDGKFNYEVAAAKDMATPAQWNLKTTFKDDSFKKTSGGTAKQYLMDFDASDLVAVGTDATGIEAPAAVGTKASEVVYDLQGRKVADSMKGLPKGVYVVGGKKYVVK